VLIFFIPFVCGSLEHTYKFTVLRGYHFMQEHNYTEPIIKGIAHTNLLPQGTALVLEGGGARAYFSAGVFEAFMKEGSLKHFNSVPP